MGSITELSGQDYRSSHLGVALFLGVERAARLGYPLLPAALQSIPEVQAKYQLYHTAWQEVERTEPPVAMSLMRVVYVAPQTHTAHQEAEAGRMHTYGRYRNLFGITYLICRTAIPPVPHDHMVRSMHLFSERVAPQLSQEC
ncbi:MAG TPA: hypothetical protein VGC99_08875 [Candidatus Tectomicrobia bacterium]